jgi:hypothetical protein
MRPQRVVDWHLSCLEESRLDAIEALRYEWMMAGTKQRFHDSASRELPKILGFSGERNKSPPSTRFDGQDRVLLFARRSHIPVPSPVTFFRENRPIRSRLVCRNAGVHKNGAVVSTLVGFRGVISNGPGCTTDALEPRCFGWGAANSAWRRRGGTAFIRNALVLAVIRRQGMR